MPEAFIWAFIFVSVWSLYPMVLHFSLSNAFHTAPYTLQGIALLGSEAMDFTVILTNYALYAALRRRAHGGQKWHGRLVWGWLVIWYAGGLINYHQWRTEVDGWSTIKIGLLQTHRESTAKRLPPEPGYTREYPIEIAMSERLAHDGAEVIVFPEGHKFGYFKELNVRKALHKAAQDMSADLLLHDKGHGNLLEGSDTPKKRNSTILIRRDGTFGGIYHKRKLVPFGEYYPVIGHDPDWIKRLASTPP